MNFRPLPGVNTKAHIVKQILVVKLHVTTKEEICKRQS